MAVKLYNHTRLPDDLLRRLLARTARRMGARSGVVVKVMRGWRQCNGYVCSASAVRESWLRRIKRGDGRWIRTDEAYMNLSIFDRRETDGEALRTAARIISLMLHEWRHVRDHQHCEVFARRGEGGRRPKWADRPEEIRANEAREEALQNPTQLDDDLELELAEALRETWC